MTYYQKLTLGKTLLSLLSTSREYQLYGLQEPVESNICSTTDTPTTALLTQGATSPTLKRTGAQCLCNLDVGSALRSCLDRPPTIRVLVYTHSRAVQTHS
jgi:hypothetical protein